MIKIKNDSHAILLFLLILLCTPCYLHGMFMTFRKCIGNQKEREEQKEKEEQRFEQSRAYLKRRHTMPDETPLMSTSTNLILARYRDYYNGAERIMAEQRQAFDANRVMLLAVIARWKHDFLKREASERKAIEYMQDCNLLMLLDQLLREKNIITQIAKNPSLKQLVEVEQQIREKMITRESEQSNHLFFTFMISSDITNAGFVPVTVD